MMEEIDNPGANDGADGFGNGGENDDESVDTNSVPEYGIIELGVHRQQECFGPHRLPKVTIRFHPAEPYLPEIVDNKIKCSYAFSEYEFRGKKYPLLEYRFDYTANGAIGFGWCCFPKLGCLGYHDKDRERLIMLLSDDMKEVEWVCFHRHSEECEWRRWEDTIHSSHGMLIVYAARAAHGFYPDEGVWTRIGCCANDLCSSEGLSYEVGPTEVHDDPISPSPHDITFWERLCVCFYLGRIRVGP